MLCASVWQPVKVSRYSTHALRAALSALRAEALLGAVHVGSFVAVLLFIPGT
jgi:hypothetical protein